MYNPDPVYTAGAKYRKMWQRAFDFFDEATKNDTTEDTERNKKNYSERNELEGSALQYIINVIFDDSYLDPYFDRPTFFAGGNKKNMKKRRSCRRRSSRKSKLSKSRRMNGYKKHVTFM
jgi:hypothetical protein